MIPRPPSCDGPDCEPTETGWLHYPDCATQTGGEDAEPEDMAFATAMEDGCYRRPAPVAAREARAA